jgi:hypothetical protein
MEWVNRERPFDRAEWLNNPEARSRMVGDLMTNYELVGSPRERIHMLLGQPKNTSPDRTTYYYWTGTDGGIDDMWLEVTFQNEIVTAFKHRPD